MCLIAEKEKAGERRIVAQIKNHVDFERKPWRRAEQSFNLSKARNDRGKCVCELRIFRSVCRRCNHETVAADARCTLCVLLIAVSN